MNTTGGRGRRFVPWLDILFTSLAIVLFCLCMASPAISKETQEVTQDEQHESHLAIEEIDKLVRERLSIAPVRGAYSEGDIPVTVPAGVMAHFRMDSPSRVTSLQFSPDGSRLVVGNQNGVCEIWDWRNELQVESIFAHRGPIRHVTFDDRAIFYTAAEDGRVMRVSVGDPVLISTVAVEDLTGALALDRDRELLAFGTHDRPGLHLIELTQGNRSRFSSLETVESVAFAGDGDSLLCISSNGYWLQKVQIASKEIGWKKSSVPDPPAASDDSLTGSAGADQPIFLDVQPLSSTGTLAVSVLGPWQGDRIEIRSLRSGELVRTLTTGSFEVEFLWCMEKRVLAVAGDPGGLWISDPMNGKKVRQLSKDLKNVSCMAYTEIGELLATGLGNGQVLLWRVQVE